MNIRRRRKNETRETNYLSDSLQAIIKTLKLVANEDKIEHKDVNRTIQELYGT